MDPLFEAPDWSSTAATLRTVYLGATRIGKALARSIGLLPAVTGQQALTYLTLDNLWTTAVVMTLWIFASVIGGPIGFAVNGILIALALYQIPELAKELGTLLKDGLQQAATARSEAELDIAATTLSNLLSMAGLEVLQVFVTHRIFVFVKPRVLRKFGVPKEIEAEHKRARAASEAKERARKAEVAEKARKLAASAAELAAASGVKPAADLVGDIMPTVGMVALGATLVAGTVVAVTLLSGRESKS